MKFTSGTRTGRTARARLHCRAAQPEGAVSGDGRVCGSYLHGLFASDGFRKALLAQLGIPASDQSYRVKVEGVLDALADHIETHLDVEGLLALAR